jgi:flavin reductase (DIM6/NTAB) family NADH-FMN oxidoreductase RutF
MKKSINPLPYVPAMPVVIVGTKDEDKINFATHGMYGQLCYEPPIIYVSVIKEHLTAKIISKTQRFSVNIPGTKLLNDIKYCGSVSGAEKDKSQVFDVFYGKNDVPLVSKCAVNMNCEVYKTIDINDMFVFMARVIEAYSDEEYLLDGIPEAVKVDPILCTIQGKFYKMGSEVE